MIPRATPVAAPVIKARTVTLVIDGVPLANRKPASPIHKVQRTRRMFIGILLTTSRSATAVAFPAISCRCIELKGNYSIG